MNRFEKEQIQPFFEKWTSINEQIQNYYAVRDRQAVVLMKTGIENYLELLEYGGKVEDERSKRLIYTLLPLNGEERFEFVKDKIDSHYAYVQLEALYDETKKKAARLNITLKKKS